jgi:hypothetical protein
MPRPLPKPLPKPLPTTVADFEPAFDEPFEHVCAELERLSIKLRDLLPDPSIGPEERLERLSRVVPHSVMIGARHLTARTKLRALRQRLDELLPGPAGACDKIDRLLEMLDQQVPNARESSTFEKLEALGDARLSDIGRSGLPHNLVADLRSLYPNADLSLAGRIERALSDLKSFRLRAS